MAEDVFGLVGTTLDGKYRIDAVAAEGGFGVVYRATHVTLQHALAVKCLNLPRTTAHDAQAHFVQRFQEEGRLLTKLDQHPSIVRVIDCGIGGGGTMPFLVMEWLQGEDLGQLLGEDFAPFTEQEALALLRPVVEALALAHALGIVHRDIKPANLFLAESVRGLTLKLVDFGIAKEMSVGGKLHGTAPSVFVAFSHAYGAPEQFRPKVFGATGPHTDVHAVGLILAELVVGHCVLRADDAIGQYEIATGEVRPTPRAHGALVSDAYERLCAKAVALMPADRHRNAQELLEEIDALLDLAPSIPTSLAISLRRAMATRQALAASDGRRSSTVDDFLVRRTEPTPAPEAVSVSGDHFATPPPGSIPYGVPQRSPAKADDAGPWKWVASGIALAALVGAGVALVIYATSRRDSAESDDGLNDAGTELVVVAPLGDAQDSYDAGNSTPPPQGWGRGDAGVGNVDASVADGAVRAWDSGAGDARAPRMRDAAAADGNVEDAGSSNLYVPVSGCAAGAYRHMFHQACCRACDQSYSGCTQACSSTASAGGGIETCVLQCAMVFRRCYTPCDLMP